MSGGVNLEVKCEILASGKRQGEQATSDKRQATRLGRGHWPTRKEERQAGKRHYRGKEKAPRGFLGALVGALDYLPLPARADKTRRRVKSKHKPR
jgi:hypothetical protein